MAKQQPLPGAGVKDGTKTPIEPGLLSRVVQGVKYMLTGTSNEWFGPGQPVAPQAQDKDGVVGRQFDFPVNTNIQRMPRDGQGASFETMRALADGYDLLRLVIETRKDQMAKMRWKFGLKKEVEQLEKAKKRKAEAEDKAANPPPPPPEPDPLTGIAPPGPAPEVKIPELPKTDPRIEELTKFFSYPDGEHDWDTWLRALLEDMLVLDAATVYPRMTRGGDKVFAMELVDGATVKRVLDQTGRTPMAPDPAYQQILKGMPAVNYHRDELIYKPRNVRTNRVYGYSPVEQIIMTVNIALRRQMSQLQYYTEGNIPEAFVGVPEEWSPDQIRQYQEYWDSIMEGNSAQKRKAKFVPGKMSVHETKGAMLQDKFDEWLARIVAFAFSISPQALVAQMNRATAETADNQAKQEGLQPVMNWVKNLMDYMVRKYWQFDDIEFAWEEEDDTNPKDQAVILKAYKDAGIMTPDECREKLGLDPLTDEQKAEAKAAAPGLPGAEAGGPPGAPKPPGGGGSPPGAKPTGGTGDPVGKSASSGPRKVKPISRNRASVRASIKGIRKLVKPALAAIQKKAVSAVRNDAYKGITADMGTQRLLAEFTWAELLDLAPSLAELIEDMVGNGGEAALAQVLAEITKDQLRQVNVKAVKYAEERSANMVKELADSTREMLRSTIALGLEEGLSNDHLADRLAAAYAFSPERADVIARTETAYADIQGNLEGYRASGVVSGKQWIIAQDEFCDACNDLDGVAVLLDGAFPDDGGDGPPLHPNCRCDVLPVLTEED